MINLAVINLKDIFKFLKKIILFLLLTIIILKICVTTLKKIKTTSFFEKKTVLDKNCLTCIDKNILLSNYLNSNYLEKNNKGLKNILESEFALFSEEELMEMENQEEVTEFEDISEKNIEESLEHNEGTSKEKDVESEKKQTVSVENIPETLETKVIETNNLNDRFTNTYNSVKIRNESKYTLTDEMLAPNVEFQNKKDIVIYHTHTCESYTPTPENTYTASGNFRTTDLNYSVARVGTELSNHLINMGFNVIHDTTYHDYPAYTGSYTRSLETINNILKKNPTSELVIDLHRDALGSSSTYGPTVQIGDEVAAQLMFVIGTDGGGLDHKDWLYNFKLAVKIQEQANLMYPGLFKPIILRDSRYNQHVTKGACIIEVGATGNTLEECNTSMKYLAKVLEAVMK